VLNLLFQDIVGWQTNGIANVQWLQILVHLRFGKGGVAPEEQTHPLALITFHRRYRTRQEAIRDITEYIEIFYKRQRLQPGLGFLSPAVFEQRYYEGLVAA
jgi:transposase InsO family protein